MHLSISVFLTNIASDHDHRTDIIWSLFCGDYLFLCLISNWTKAFTNTLFPYDLKFKDILAQELLILTWNVQIMTFVIARILSFLLKLQFLTFSGSTPNNYRINILVQSEVGVIQRSICWYVFEEKDTIARG